MVSAMYVMSATRVLIEIVGCGLIKQQFTGKVLKMVYKNYYTVLLFEKHGEENVSLTRSVKVVTTLVMSYLNIISKINESQLTQSVLH